MNQQLHLAIVWITGLPSTGKTTLAAGLRQRLAAAAMPSLLLDGDDLRSGLCQGLGFSDADRTENLRRAAEVAALAARSGIATIAAMITPLKSQREMIAQILAGHRLLWVWADCPAAECQRRDVKGLYRKQRAGTVSNLTGADGLFEAPGTEALRLDTSQLSVAQCVDTIWASMEAMGEPQKPGGLADRVLESGQEEKARRSA